MRRFMNLFAKKTNRQVTGKQRASLSLETLGERIAPATGIFRSALGIVTIEGTAGDDTSKVSVSGKDVTVTLNSTSATFPLAKVRGLVFKGLNGNDSFTNNSSLPSTGFGGNGDDTLTGGSAADQFFGGMGKDLLTGNGGNDNLNGEAGDDSLQGGDGNDIEHGGPGDDSVLGGSGNDSLFGDAGNDRMSGDLGKDRVSGGTGVDASIRDSNDSSDDSDQNEGSQQADGLAKVEGTITVINGSSVTIHTAAGVDVQLNITATTVLEKNDVHVALADFAVGDKVEAKFDSATNNAFKLETGGDNSNGGGGNQSGQAQAEGTVTAVGTSSVSIKLQNGTIITILIDANTKLERNDLHVALSAFQVGDRGEANYDSTTLLATKFEAVG